MESFKKRFAQSALRTVFMQNETMIGRPFMISKTLSELLNISEEEGIGNKTTIDFKKGASRWHLKMQIMLNSSHFS